MRRASAGCAAVVLGLLLATPATAAGPQIASTWVTGVTASSVNLHAELDPEGAATTYRFEYLTAAAYLANGETFAGAAKAPPGAAVELLSTSGAQEAFQHVGGLKAATAYRYRVLATNSSSPPGGTPGPVLAFTTEEAGVAFALLDQRGWELVSPLEKNGGAVRGPGQIFGGGVLQAAAAGSAVTYGSSSSFAPGAQGAPGASQYLARRGEGGWSTADLTVPPPTAKPRPASPTSSSPPTSPVACC
jgi:hypothetical protein